MAMQLDLEQLLRVAQLTGALSGNTPGYGPAQLTRGKEASLTLSTMATLFGCCGLFANAGNNPLLTLTLEDEPFLTWLGWKPNNECRQFVELLSYVGPAGTAAGSASAGVAGACDDANGVEYGTCEILLPDKGRIKRAGPVRDITESSRGLTNRRPVIMKDGQPITDELMWALTLAGMGVKQDLKRLLITGNASNANEFSGLQKLVNTGYVNVHDARRCSAMDSTVLNWANNVMSHQLNGVHNLVAYIISIVRRIRQRAMWSSLGGVAVGDQILMMPTFLRDELLNAYTCWSVCPGSQYNETNLNTYEARQKRDSLNGGAFGMGQIFVDSEPVPIITYDWQAVGQAAPYFTGDIYVLTRAIGNVPVLWGQYIDMTDPAAAFDREAGYAHYKAVDDGRFLVYWKTDNECVSGTTVLRPNVYLSAPWAQARIMNVAARTALDPLSPDPTSGYYGEEYLAVASCPEDYLTTSPV